jgi:hypothetical protein
VIFADFEPAHHGPAAKRDKNDVRCGERMMNNPKAHHRLTRGPTDNSRGCFGFEADRKQLLNYLRGSKIEVGLLLHFGRKARFYRLLYTNDRKPHLDGPT